MNVVNASKKWSEFTRASERGLAPTTAAGTGRYDRRAFQIITTRLDVVLENLAQPNYGQEQRVRPRVTSPTTSYLLPQVPTQISQARIIMDRRGGGGGRKVLLPPINFIFKLLQTHTTVQIWLYEQLSIRIEGKLRVGGH